MNLSDYRATDREQQRTADLLRLIPLEGATALDIGARDGHFSRLLAQRFNKVIALDLSKPAFECPKVECVQGNATALQFGDRTIDFVFCAEVLEHIPSHLLADACREIGRVSNEAVLIGVPYRQDIRVGRTTCATCGGKNPPWGHVNAFDEHRLAALYPAFQIANTSFVSSDAAWTNRLSSTLMDWAGNPFGTYGQDEPCIHCGSALRPPAPRNLGRKVLTRLAHWSRRATETFSKPRAAWIHVLMVRRR